MRNTARALLPLAVFFLFSACRSIPSDASVSQPSRSADGLAVSPRRIIGRVLAVDPVRSFVIIDLAAKAPLPALVLGDELMLRTDDLTPTARVRVARPPVGRTLGTVLLSGDPQVGDEVVLIPPP
jgi:hypothetical protein